MSRTASTHGIEPEPSGTDDATGERTRKSTLDALDVFEELDERIQRGQGYATEDPMYCIYSLAGPWVRGGPGNATRPRDRVAEVRRLMESIESVRKAGSA